MAQSRLDPKVRDRGWDDEKGRDWHARDSRRRTHPTQSGILGIFCRLFRSAFTLALARLPVLRRFLLFGRRHRAITVALVLVLLFTLSLLAAQSPSRFAHHVDVLTFVDPLIGTVNGGLQATAPSAFVSSPPYVFLGEDY